MADQGGRRARRGRAETQGLDCLDCLFAEAQSSTAKLDVAERLDGKAT